MRPRGEVLVAGLLAPEGPCVRRDGTVLFTQQLAGEVSLLDDRGVSTVCRTDGGPNSCVEGTDGVYVCQNGGVVGSWRSSRPQEAGIQRIDEDGTVTMVTREVDGQALVTPNDLAFGPDGALYFTDPAQPYDPGARTWTGAVYALTAPRPTRVQATPATYCNGIGFDEAGRLLWVESYPRAVWRREADMAVRRLCLLPHGHVPDGFAVAEDGRIFVASCGSHGITVVSPEGELLDHVTLDEQAYPSNCCFDGSDLLVTDFGTDMESRPDAGRLWRVPTDARGAPTHTGTVQPTPPTPPAPPTPPMQP